MVSHNRQIKRKNKSAVNNSRRCQHPTALPRKKFQRRVENFTCLNCGLFVEGDGFRNHCPQCLFSRHVDINPGDRAATCLGLMRVADVKLEHGQLILMHCCVKCGHHKRNQAQFDDSIDSIVKCMRQKL